MIVYNKDRKYPVKKFDDFTELDGLVPATEFFFTAGKNEYFVVQLLLTKASGDCTITTSGLDDRITVYNTQGVDKYGNDFIKSYSLTDGEINPLYIGVDFDTLEAGEYDAVVHVQGDENTDIRLQFTVENEEVENHGYNELWRLSRLNWLNSRRAVDNDVVKPFTPIVVDGGTVKLLGRDVVLGDDMQIQQVKSCFDEGVNLMDTIQAELLASPTKLTFENETIAYGERHIENMGGNARVTAVGESENLLLETEIAITSEGFVEYFVSVAAKNDVQTTITLSVPYSKYASKYNYGLGKYGGEYENVDFRWNDLHQDCMYIGNVNTGALVRLKDVNYRKPLINVYYHNLPLIRPVDTWENGGAGRITAEKGNGGATLTATTGKYTLKQGEKRVFRYEFSLTPYKPIDYKKHYATRYHHSNKIKNKEYKYLDKAEQLNMSHMILHHGNEINPYINYPFTEVDAMKRFVADAKSRGIGVKLYYTTREMSNHTAELFAYKALGSEIILQMDGEGLDSFNDRKWLTEYFGKNIIPAWQVHYKSGKHKGKHDIAFIIQPDSRVENYYIEGLQWLVDHFGIAGIYIDDTSLDGTTLRRAKKVLDPVGGLIDMHTWNHEEPRAGDATCINIYADILPFLDSLWIGEGFDCRKLAPDYIFTEVSGLSYGVPSQMLEGGGDPYVGMLYAMNNRYGWGAYNADKLHTVWDDFEIQNAEMLGYWHSKCPIKTDNKNVLVTVYKKEKEALVAVYNFSEKSETFQYEIDEKLLGFSPKIGEAIKLKSPELFKGKSATKLSEQSKLSKRDGVLFTIRR